MIGPMGDDPPAADVLGMRTRLVAAAPGRFDDGRDLVAIGEITLPARVAVWDPAEYALTRTVGAGGRVDAACAGGRHEVVALTGGRLELVAVLVRRSGAAVARWSPLTVDFDEHAVVGPADGAAVEYPGPDDADGRDPRSWVHLGDLGDGRSFVWVEDPSGAGRMHAAVGLDGEGGVAAILVACVDRA